MTRTGQISRWSSIRRNLISALPRRWPQLFLNVALGPQPIVLATKPGNLRRQVRRGMRGRRRYQVPRRPRIPPSAFIAPVAQHRGGNTQLACDPAQRPTAAHQQGYRFPLELIRKMTPSLAHSTPFRSHRSLAKVSTNSREAHNGKHSANVEPAYAGLPMSLLQTRRRFLTTLSLAAAARFVGAPAALAAEEPLETTAVRFVKIPGICNAPQYVAEEVLRAEGFTDISYVGLVAAGAPAVEAVARSNADFTVTFAAPLVIGIDGGAPVTVVSGVHIGCFELFGNESVHSIADLKGKSVGVQGFGSSQHVFTAAMAAYVGLDPAKDIHWVINPQVKPTERYEKGEIDAFLGFPPEPQDLRARHIGRVIVNSAADRPWSQYFCCMLAGSRDFVSRYPVATKPVLRELCGSEPSRGSMT